MSRLLIQIVPALPPAINGVGDYALAVGSVLRSEFGLDSVFVVGNPRWEGPDEIDGFPIRRVVARTANRLTEALDAGASGVLLHLSCYGYSGRGCPLWLMQGLKQWKTKRPDARLVTMFHELYASGPPWSSAFWVKPAQKMVVASLLRRSDTAITNIELYREVLDRLDASKRGRIGMLAIPSNVGEPMQPPELNARARKMIVFGQPPLRKLTYETQMEELARACEELGIEQVDDVGNSFPGIPERVGGLRVKKHGLLGASELSALLSDSLAGFVTYPRAFLAKSGVFAAYCAHRLVPVLPEMTADRRPDADGLAGGVHYLRLQKNLRAEPALPKQQRIADAAWNWYRGHSLQHQARAFAEALTAPGTRQLVGC
jgi:hypothetical protein